MRVAHWSGSLAAWEAELSALKARIGPVFGRRELRETAGAFLDGLLSGVERKTGWLMAEQAGLDHPTRIQALLGRSRWEADALRDQVRADVLEALGDPDGVLVVDETGFVKKGTHSRSGWPGNIPARPGGSRTRTSACSWPMRADTARR